MRKEPRAVGAKIVSAKISLATHSNQRNASFKRESCGCVNMAWRRLEESARGIPSPGSVAMLTLQPRLEHDQIESSKMSDLKDAPPSK